MARRAWGSMPPTVVLGGAFSAWSCARTLRRYGVDVRLLPDRSSGPGYDGNARHNGHASGHASAESGDGRGALASVVGGPEHWIGILEASEPSIRGAVLIPCSDDALEFVAQRRPQLTDWGYRPIPANDDAVLAMLDKARTYAIALKADVPVPKTSVVASMEDLRAAAAQFSYPCALKPAHSHRFQRYFSVKAFVVDGPAELESCYRSIMHTHEVMLLTEIVRGVDDEYCSYYTFIEEDGTPLVTLTKRKLRQYPTGFGLGTFHATRWEPEAAVLGLSFARHAKLRGLVNVEFKRDARDGRLKLIECNVRLTAANELVRRAGVDLSRLAYDRALSRAAAVPRGFREGVYEWHPFSDLRAFREYRSRGELTAAQWVQSLAHPRLGLPAVDRREMLESVARTARYLLGTPDAHGGDVFPCPMGAQEGKEAVAARERRAERAS